MLSLLSHNWNKTIVLIILLVVATATIIVVALREQTKPVLNDVKIVEDDLGRTVIYKYPPLKIISLAPSISEMLFSICPSDLIIGRTQNCNYPKEVLNKTIINNYPINYEKLVLLKPDIVFALEGIISVQDADRLHKLNIPTYIFKINTVDDILSKMKQIGNLTNQAKIANHKSDSIANLIKMLPQERIVNKNTLMIISAEPLYVFGLNNYASDMLKLAGGVNALDKTITEHYPVISREYLLKLDPDNIITTDTNFFKQLSIKFPEIMNLKAFKNNKLRVINEDLLSRPSPRVYETLLEIKKALN